MIFHEAAFIPKACVAHTVAGQVASSVQCRSVSIGCAATPTHTHTHHPTRRRRNLQYRRVGAWNKRCCSVQITDPSKGAVDVDWQVGVHGLDRSCLRKLGVDNVRKLGGGGKVLPAKDCHRVLTCVQNGVCRFINTARVSLNKGWEEPHQADTAGHCLHVCRRAGDAQQHRRVFDQQSGC